MLGRPAAVVLLALLVAGCGGRDPYDALPRPDPVEPLEDVVTTQPPGLGDVVLPAARGTTTTTVAMGPGPLQIVGRVEGPDGPVGGAIVRLERFVGDGSASVEVPTAPDGTWNVENVLGGRYRIRAWQQPSLAMIRAQVLFVEQGRHEPVFLRLDRYEGRRVDGVIAPDPPLVDEQANLKVRVADRMVDERGIVRTTPRPGISVRLTASGSWFVTSPNPQSTGADGAVTFRVECTDEGPQPLSVVLDGGESVPLDLPACVDPSAPPTTESTTTTTSSSTTTSSTTTTTEP
jgi:hypothetical protein